MQYARQLPILAIVGVVLATLLGSSPPAVAASAAPFGHSCSGELGIRFCPTDTPSQRVRSFDGVPLDVDVTLPASGNGPYPTIVMLHGWGQNKGAFETSEGPAAEGNENYAYNNIYYAQHGFAVVTYTARGWGNSCGSLGSRSEGDCGEGFMRYADQRYEARDTQFLLGELVDEGIAKAGALGVTGESYGAAQSIELAYLRNRIRLPNGHFAPWRSPKGTPLSIDAVWARWPWSDLMSALWPNGRFLDSQVAPLAQSTQPVGVEHGLWISSFVGFAEEAEGFMGPPAIDTQDDLSVWDGIIGGQPGSPQATHLAEQLTAYHQAYGLPGRPAPMLLESGWTDGIFPPEQSLLIYNAVRAKHGQVALQVGDLGHSPADNKTNTDRYFNMEGARFFAAHLRHVGRAPSNYGVNAYTLTCPTSTPGGGPYYARNWRSLHPQHISFGSSAAQSFTSAGANPKIAAAFDPGFSDEACRTVSAEVEPNTATYTTTSSGVTLLGMSTVTATVHTTGALGQIDSRLWDVLPDGQQRLVDRGVYRLTTNQQGRILFQLHGNGYHFAQGDQIKLELLGRDAPYYTPSPGAFSVQVSNLEVSLPIS